MKYRAAIFDMDGTILSTIEDLSDSLNYSLGECGHRSDFTIEETKSFFGSGIRNAIRRAIANEKGAEHNEYMMLGTANEGMLPSEYMPEDEEVARIQKVFNGYYPEHCAIKTGPYPGIHEMLDSLIDAGVLTAVVSNKIDPAVQELVKEHFNNKFSAALGESSSFRRKPYPDMVIEVLKRLDVQPGEAVYIGDSEVDVQTARNAGLDCIEVDWGFRTRADIEAAGAEVIVSEAEEIPKLIIG